MNLPDQPPTFRPPSAVPHPWRWRLNAVDGSEIESEQYVDQRFPNQADAESWVGEVWAELASEGADAVTLFEGEREVYGPMSLHP